MTEDRIFLSQTIQVHRFLDLEAEAKAEEVEAETKIEIGIEVDQFPKKIVNVECQRVSRLNALTNLKINVGF